MSGRAEGGLGSPFANPVTLLAESELLRHRTCCTLNYICNLLGM